MKFPPSKGKARKLKPQERYARRQKHARPVFDELRTWLKATLPQIAPSGATGQALNYLHNEWHRLVRYLEDGRLEIDNNLAENAIEALLPGDLKQDQIKAG